MNVNEKPDVIAYAAFYKNDIIREKSSSGAVFSLLAGEILAKRGVVYGVAMSSDCRSAEYIRIDSENELERLRGSKYIQAKMGNTYKQVQEDLRSGKQVLFSGTGCQVNGLKCFLNENYENLYCVDVICHGVSSPGLWKKYVDCIEDKYNVNLTDVNFRCKDRNWKDFGVKEVFSNHKEIYSSKSRNPYMQMFLRNYSLRPSCYACTVKTKKLSDITIGDFWGIENVVPEMDDGKGTSLVLIRTEKGKMIFKDLEKDLNMKEVSYEEGVRKNSAEYESVLKPKGRDTFFNDMKQMDFKELETKYTVVMEATLIKRVKRKIKRFFRVGDSGKV